MATVAIRERKTDNGGFTHLLLERPPGYDFVPGQYAALTLKEGDKAKFLAIASHTNETDLLFLLRDSVPAEGRLALTAPQGKGFTCDFADKRPLLYLTHGTGISAIRPVMLERQKRGFAHDTLLYGIASAAHEPDLDCLRADFGAQQLRAFSKAEYKAYVQDLVRTLDLEHFGAVLLVGSNEMMVTCRELLANKNFPAERIFSNY